MEIIGLTGGIASGKSTVAQILTALGVKVIDADVAARKVVLPESELLRKLVEQFGSDILLPDRTLNRERLGEKIFNDDKSRQRLNGLIHPAIREELFRQIKKCEEEGRRFVFIDIPLLFETDWHKLTKENWLVYVDEHQQVERLMKRNYFSRAQAIARMQSQMRLSDKVKLADVVIDNNRDLAYTKLQVGDAWNTLQNRLSNKSGRNAKS